MLRKLLFSGTLLASMTAIGGIWLERPGLRFLRHADQEHLDAFLATAIQTSSGVGGIALALVFVTAQLGMAQRSAIRELYRSVDVYALALCFVATLVLGYWCFATHTPVRLADTVFVLACTTPVLIVPVLLLQLENLDRTVVAGKLALRITPKALRAYGLTDVHVPAGATPIGYRLRLVGTRTDELDPLRPIHEVIMDAVDARDRVLFGKLIFQLLQPVARVHGLSWDGRGRRRTSPAGRARRWIGARRFSDADRVHVTLAIAHYCVKRARNLLTEWEGRDIGRHGALTGLGDMVRSMAYVSGQDATAKICVYAILRIARLYRDVTPYGRVEPLSELFDAADWHWRQGRLDVAVLCTEVLAWVSAHGKQLSEERCASVRNTLPTALREAFDQARERCVSQKDWLPGRERDDPWRKWPPA